MTYLLLLVSALKWYRRNENIQAEVEEMQEEQDSLSSIVSVSVWGLLTDRCVRWQVITIVVVNIGMQLSGIDAVSLKSVCVCVCYYRYVNTLPLLVQQVLPIHLHLHMPLHHVQCLSRGATGARLIIFWPSPLIFPNVRHGSSSLSDSELPFCLCTSSSPPHAWASHMLERGNGDEIVHVCLLNQGDSV